MCHSKSTAHHHLVKSQAAPQSRAEKVRQERGRQVTVGGGNARQGKRRVCKAREVKAKIEKGTVCKAGKTNKFLSVKKRRKVVWFHIHIKGYQQHHAKEL